MTPLEVVTFVKDSFVAAAAVVGVLVAVKGLSAWKKQLRGKTEYDVARDLLRAGYRLRDAIGAVRHPLMLSAEAAHALREKRKSDCLGGDQEHCRGEARDEFQRASAAAYELRWRGVVDAHSALQLAAVEAELLWSEQAVQGIVPIRKCTQELGWALREYLDRDTPPRVSDDERAMLRQVRSVVFWTSDDPTADPFSGRLAEAIEALERFVRPKLQ